MAQGFVANSNLVESSSFLQDKGILDNLGGIGISDDIRLFVGNLQHKSRLINNPNELGDSIAFGALQVTKRYKISDTGTDRDWTVVGWVANQDGHGATPALNDIFVADASGQGTSGSLGAVTELVSVREFDAINDPIDGWTIVVRPRRGRVAFTQGTKVSLDGGTSYPYIIVNSDGVEKFQIADALNLSNIYSLSGGVDNMTITRNDSLTIENFKNAHITPTGTSTLLETRADSLGLEGLSPDPYGAVLSDSEEDNGILTGGIPDVQINISAINQKKSKVILTYLNNRFRQDNGIRFDGAVRVVNEPNLSGKILSIGVDTNFGDLVAGAKYKITLLGGSSWPSVGANQVVDGLTQISVSSSNLTAGSVYKIINTGYSSLGTNGVLTFADTAVNDTLGQESIQLTSGSDHGLQTNDVVTFAKVSGADISLLVDGAQYFVIRVDTENIKLSGSTGGVAIDLTKSGTPTGQYTLTADIQGDWNALAGTSGATYVNGNFFTATSLSNANALSGAIVSDVVFVATGTGGSPVTTSKARVVDGNGLYITNPANGEAKRAFTGKDNPWNKVDAQTLSINSSVTSAFQNSSGVNLPGVTGSAPNLTLTLPVLKTTSDTAQAGNFLFDRQDETNWGSFIIGESYTISDLGTSRDWSAVFGTTNYADLVIGESYTISAIGSNDWNAVAGTSGGNYQVGNVVTIVSAPVSGNNGSVGKRVVVVGSSFIATATGPSGGSGGKAIGEPKLLFTNTGQDEIPDDGLSTDSNSFSRSTTEFTHKIPITVNGENYFLLAYANSTDVAAGNYKVLTMEESY
jgi:hypothetical protein